MIVHRLEQKGEQRAWEMYLMRYQHMDKNTYKPFEYKKPQPLSKRSTEDILREAAEIEKAIQKGK